MASLNVVDVKNKKAGKVELSAEVFEAPVRPHLFHAEVRRQLARRHRGTHSTKNRSAVSGGGAKPWRQKGTGRARQGSTRSPQWAGGGAVFGPVPRGHQHSLNKKTRKAALRSALSQRLQEEAITVVDELVLDEFKTKRMLAILEAVGVGSESTLIVVNGENEQVEVSAQNLPGVDVLRVEGLNVYDVLRHQKLLLTKDALAQVETRLASAAKESDE
ncbi:MAG: 50S ribosomal protein L4 [Proteobacteria bacterium]|nr:50S ribosomal protein L4 [Pseudomonadota bacterium]